MAQLKLTVQQSIFSHVGKAGKEEYIRGEKRKEFQEEEEEERKEKEAKKGCCCSLLTIY